MEKAISTEDLISRRQEVADTVKKEYYDILKIQSGLEAVEEEILFLKKLYILVKRNLELERVLEKELLDVEALLAKSEYKKFVLKNDLATLKENFNFTLGRGIETPFRVNARAGSGAHRNQPRRGGGACSRPAPRGQGRKARHRIRRERCEDREIEVHTGSRARAEEMHAKGELIVDSLVDAGIERLRPVMITVGAKILALFPLAIEGGPLWQPLCYAQIGGLELATVIELLLVPAFYSIFVLDLKIIKWSKQN